MPWSSIPKDESSTIDGELFAAPNWMIEILSPDQSQTKVVKKILRSVRYGSEMGWLIDPAEKCVFSYLPNTLPAYYEILETPLPVPEFASDFKLTMGELIGWLYA